MTEQEQFQKRSSTYVKIGLIFAYSFALLHALGAFFGWVLFAGASYCFALAFYYRRLSMPQQESSHQQWTQPNRPFNQTATTQISFTKILRFLPMIIGAIVIVSIAAAIFSVGSNIADNEQNTVTDDSAVSETIEQKPSTAEAFVDRGNEFYNNNEYDSALFYYGEALKLKPDYQEAEYNIALVYSNQTKYDEAITVIDRCLQQHPDYGEAWQLKGDCVYYQKKEDEALGLYEKSYALGTRNAYLSHMLAYLYDVRENTSKAIGLYKEAIQLDSSKVEVYKRLAELEPDKADWYTRKAEQWSSNN